MPNAYAIQNTEAGNYLNAVEPPGKKNYFYQKCSNTSESVQIHMKDLESAE